MHPTPSSCVCALFHSALASSTKCPKYPSHVSVVDRGDAATRRIKACATLEQGQQEVRAGCSAEIGLDRPLLLRGHVGGDLCEIRVGSLDQCLDSVHNEGGYLALQRLRFKGLDNGDEAFYRVAENGGVLSEAGKHPS